MPPHEKAIPNPHGVRKPNQSSKRSRKRFRREDYRRTLDPYQPLDKERMEIRLLVVKAGHDSHTIRCELEHAFLTSDPKPEYETVSYCWGDPSITSSVMLNGKRTKVPASSKAAIACMRLPDADRVLWIDALCINQADPEERGHQVKIMGSVYSNNQRNLIYLGESDETTTTKALDMIERILKNAQRETKQYEAWDDVLTGQTGQFTYSETGIELGADLLSLFDFFSSAPWFGRLWVAQEAVLSRVNICHRGQHKFPLDDVLRASRWLLYKDLYLPFYPRDQLNISNAACLFDLWHHSKSPHHMGIPGLDLVQILAFMRDLEVRDPRDRIYAILALHEYMSGTPALANCMVPDYSKTLRCVMRDAARFAIIERRDLVLFNYVGIFSPSDISPSEYWPSWMPPWHLKYEDDECPASLKDIFDADDKMRLDMKAIKDELEPDQLTVTGYMIDAVSECLPVTTRQILSDGEQMCHHLYDLRMLLRRHSSTILPPDLGPTLLAGVNHARERATRDECDQLFAWSAYIEETKEIPTMPESTETADGSDAVELYAYNQAIWKALCNRCFFVATSGSMGLGPRRMRPQDIIAILHGCRWPVVLRTDGECYRIIGVSYVHGIMDGEAVRKMKGEGKEPEVIIIR